MKSRKLVLLVAFLFVALFWSCSQKEDSIVNPNSTDLMKGKPTPEKATLDYFQLVVNGTDVYNIGKQPLPVIDFTSSNTYQLKYKITHSDPNFTTLLRFSVQYNPNNNSRSWYYGWVIDTMAIAGEEYSLQWDGNVVYLNSLNAAYYFHTDGYYKFMDQKANSLDVPSQIIADPYTFYVSGNFNYYNEGETRIEEMWIKAPEGLGEMHVESITIIPKPLNKRQCIPQVTLKLSMKDDSPCVGAQVLWNWGGNIIGDDYIRGISPLSNGDGEITITGPSYNISNSGNIIFTVKSVYKSNFVYNPYLNTAKGTWPIEPYDLLPVP